MCQALPKGTTINCDNWYTSVNAAIKLKQKYGVFIRGTLRSNRKFLPKYKLTLTNKEKKERGLPRGFRKVAVNREHGIVAVSWLDKRPVLFLSTADGTEECTVRRRQGSKKVIVPAPQCVLSYTEGMGGVDRHDQLRLKFSIHSRHHFKKYYIGLYLCLFDMALTNAYICYKMTNPEKCKTHESRASFLESIANEFLSNDTKWMDNIMLDPLATDAPVRDNEDEVLYDLGVLGSSPVKKKPSESNQAQSALFQHNCQLEMYLHDKPKSHEGQCCQICLLELRKPPVKNVGFCPTHKIRLCTTPIITNNGPYLDWMCPHRNWSCSQKFHEYYLPKGVFGKSVEKRRFITMLKGSDIAKARAQYMEANPDQLPARVERRRKRKTSAINDEE